MDIALDPKATALVMVDMQNDFCHPRGFYARAAERIRPLGLEPKLVQESIRPMQRLLDAARRAGLFIAHTQIVRDASPDAVHMIHKIVATTFKAVADVPGGPALMPGTWGAQTHDDLKPLPGEYVVQKRAFSAFYGTDLEMALRRRGIKTLVLAGTITYACVLHTAFDANARDFDVVVASDGTASWAPELQQPALRMVEMILGASVPVAELIEKLAATQRRAEG